MKYFQRRDLVSNVADTLSGLDLQRYHEVLAIAATRKIADDDEKEKLADSIAQLINSLEPPDYHEVLELVAMRRPWRPKHTGWVNAFDQLLHALYAAVVFLPLVVAPSYWTAAASGFVLGALREIEQFRNWDLRIPMIWDRLQDAAFFAVGAVILYLVVAG